MDKATKVAGEKYPHGKFDGELGDSLRAACAVGYMQAEKDLALTPDDIGLINKLLFDMHFEGFDVCSTEKAHERNVEVLRRFNELRNKK